MCGVIVAAVPLASAQSTYSNVPSRIVGQPLLNQLGGQIAVAPNLAEGRELWFPQALAVDTSVNPPILYVSDFLNNRVLAWKNASAFQKGDPADLVIGQRDKYSTVPKGPGSDLATGLNQPTGLAVDKSGNLYVADSGNNRILRYPAPFQQQTTPLSPDLVLGQKDLTGRTANQGTNPSEKTVSFQGQFVGLAVDASGNLWVSDGNNNRILRYPAATLSAATSQPAADLVLGQTDFATTKLPQNFNRSSKNGVTQPGALAFSPSGLLFVADSANRVLVYVPPFTTGESASRIMGIVVVPQGSPAPTGFTDTSLGAQTSTGANIPPSGIFFIGDNPFVIDTGVNRILEYDPFTAWPTEATQYSPSAIKVFGQPDFSTSQANAGQPQSGDNSFAFPTQAALAGNDLIVVDSGNNRVVAIPNFTALAAQGGTAIGFHATRLLGQVDFKYNSINLIEGREFDIFDGQHGAGGGVAVDTVSSTPHLYVADVFNNRVLGFKDARTVKPGQTADIVIGQPDFFTGIVNYPSGDAQHFNQTGLFLPENVAVDPSGNLWVTDAGNGRVLRYPAPFNQPAGTPITPNLVLGKAYFSGQNNPDASAQNMRFPYGIAFTPEGHVAISDYGLNRILFFQKPTGGDFSNGQLPTNVLGQPDFNSSAATYLRGPRGLAFDGSDRLYVADSANNRVVIYPTVLTLAPGAATVISSLILTGNGNQGDNFNGPSSIAIDRSTSEIWVADTGNGRLVRFPTYDTLISSPLSNFIMSGGLMSPALSISLDSFGNPVIAEAANRVAFYYRLLGSSIGNTPTTSGNAANYFQRFAPGMIAAIKPSSNSKFGSDTTSASTLPLPTTLGDVQVFVNGVAAPLFYVSPSQINMQIPSATPVGSTPVEFDVVRASTSQVLATGLFRIDPFSPGLFTVDATGVGQVLAYNQDNTLNDASHPAKDGTVIQLFGTGYGVVPGAPPDGQPAQGLITTPITPVVFINAKPADVQFSGLAPNFVGLWQINAVVPADAPPGQVNVVIVMNGIISTQDPFGNRITTTIYTKP